MPSALSAFPGLRRSRRSLPSVVLPLVLALFSLGLTGCGYSLVGQGTNIPEDVERVFIQALENQTQRQLLEQFLTEAIADEMVRRPRFEVVAGPEEADAILSGAVVRFGLLPIAFDADGRANEYEVSITARVSFQRTDEDETVLWANDRYLFRQNYQVDTGVAAFDREDEAAREAAERFAETMVTDLLEGF